jgi:hypothetical protein
MKKPIRLVDLKRISEHRPEGYYEDVLSKGEIIGDSLWIEWDNYTKLLAKYSPNKKSVPCSSCGDNRKYKGLGDIIAVPANAIARVIDKVAGTHIEGCSSCAERRKKLNELMPFSKSE